MNHSYTVPLAKEVTLALLDKFNVPRPTLLVAPSIEDAMLNRAPHELVGGTPTTRGTGVETKIDKWGVPYLDFDGGANAWVSVGDHPMKSALPGTDTKAELTVMCSSYLEASGDSSQAYVSVWQANDAAKRHYWFGTTDAVVRDMGLRVPGASGVQAVDSVPYNTNIHNPRIGSGVRGVGCVLVRYTGSPSNMSELNYEFMSNGHPVTIGGSPTFEVPEPSPSPVYPDLVVGAMKSGESTYSENLKGKVYWLAMWDTPLSLDHRVLLSKVDTLRNPRERVTTPIISGTSGKEWFVNPDTVLAQGAPSRVSGEFVSQYSRRYIIERDASVECLYPGYCAQGTADNLEIGYGRQDLLFDGQVIWAVLTGRSRQTAARTLESIITSISPGDTVWMPHDRVMDVNDLTFNTGHIEESLPLGPRIKFRWYDTVTGEERPKFIGAVKYFSFSRVRMYLKGYDSKEVVGTGSFSDERRFKAVKSDVLLDDYRSNYTPIYMEGSTLRIRGGVLVTGKLGDLSRGEEGFEADEADLVYDHGPVKGQGHMIIENTRMFSNSVLFGASRITYDLKGCQLFIGRHFSITVAPNPVKFRVLGCSSNMAIAPYLEDDNRRGFVDVKVDQLTGINNRQNNAWYGTRTTGEVYREKGNSLWGDPVSLALSYSGSSNVVRSVPAKFNPVRLAVWCPTPGNKKVTIHCARVGSLTALPVVDEMALDCYHLNLGGDKYVTTYMSEGVEYRASSVTTTAEPAEGWVSTAGETPITPFSLSVDLTGVGVGWVHVHLAMGMFRTYVCPTIDLEPR